MLWFHKVAYAILSPRDPLQQFKCPSYRRFAGVIPPEQKYGRTPAER
jgi:hypothetical protein